MPGGFRDEEKITQRISLKLPKLSSSGFDTNSWLRLKGMLPPGMTPQEPEGPWGPRLCSLHLGRAVGRQLVPSFMGRGQAGPQVCSRKAPHGSEKQQARAVGWLRAKRGGRQGEMGSWSSVLLWAHRAATQAHSCCPSRALRTSLWEAWATCQNTPAHLPSPLMGQPSYSVSLKGHWPFMCSPEEETGALSAGYVTKWSWETWRLGNHLSNTRKTEDLPSALLCHTLKMAITCVWIYWEVCIFRTFMEHKLIFH